MSGIHVRLLLEHTRVAAGHERRLRAVVRLTAPRVASAERAPVDLVACLDVSGSMEGHKLDEARSSAIRLVRELDGRDRLSLVAFSSRAECLAPLRSMDPNGRASLGDIARQLHTLGNTNMSAGLLTSLEALREAPRPNEGRPTLRRVLFFTDGHANEGLPEADHAGWASLLHEQLGDASVSWFGYGEDHDATFLAWLADQTRGNAYVARDADAIADAFAKELGGLLGTAAQQVRVRVRTPILTPILLNEERVVSSIHGLTVELNDLSSEERRDLVFELPISAGALGESARVVEVDVSWVDTRTGRADSVTLSGEVAFVAPGEVDVPSLEVREALVLQQAVAAMRQAAALAEPGEFGRAEALLLEAALVAHEVPTDRAREFGELLRKLARDYGDRTAYASSKSRLANIHRSMSKQRSSGSVADSYFETDEQRQMREKFGAPPASAPQTPRPPRGPRRKI